MSGAFSSLRYSIGFFKKLMSLGSLWHMLSKRPLVHNVTRAMGRNVAWFFRREVGYYYQRMLCSMYFIRELWKLTHGLCFIVRGQGDKLHRTPADLVQLQNKHLEFVLQIQSSLCYNSVHCESGCNCRSRKSWLLGENVSFGIRFPTYWLPHPPRVGWPDVLF